MENFIDLVNRRYSVRDFLPRQVEREKINLCLEAARLAPSACNSQPWEFIIVDDPGIKAELCGRIFSGPYMTNAFVKKAPVLAVVVSQKGSFISKIGSYLRDTRLYLIDIGIACEHFVLQAAELGLGTCWIGWFNEKEIKKALSVPGDKRVDVIIAMGYPSNQPTKKIRKSIDEISNYNNKT